MTKEFYFAIFNHIIKLNLPSSVSEDCIDIFKEYNVKSRTADLNIVLKNNNKNVNNIVLNEKKNEVVYNKIKIIENQNIYLLESTLFNGKLGSDYEYKLPAKYGKFPLIIRNIVRSAYAIFLLQKDGFLLHSSSIIYNKKSNLFSGLPGSGKTTLAEFAKKTGFTTQGDEFIAIRKINNIYYSFATPFGGSVRPDIKKSKISKIFFIKQSTKLSKKRLGFTESVPMLLQNEFVSMSVHFKNKTQLQKFAIKKAIDFCNHISCYELHFPYKENILKKII